MRETILKKLAAWHALYPWRMLLLAGSITVILGWFAGQLSITMRTSDLLPSGDRRVAAYNKILDEFVTASNLTVVVQGDEDRIKEFAESLAPRIIQLRDTSRNENLREEIEKLEQEVIQLKEKEKNTSEIAQIRSEIKSRKIRINMQMFQRVDFKAEVEFLRKNALMLIKEDDLKNTKDIFTDPNLTALLRNINNSMEKEYVGQEESISTREKEEGAVVFLDGIQNLISTLQSAVRNENITEREVEMTVDKLLFGEPYMLSRDKTTLLMFAIPNFTVMDRDLIITGTEAMQSLVDEMLEDFPDVNAGLSGVIAKEHDEQIASEKSLGNTTLLALGVILLLLMVSFRMWVAPLLALVTLVVGLLWALGASAITVGQLNMVTSAMSVVLLGLGIDFAIHFISGFTEWRAGGESIVSAMEHTFLKSGKGIITGAITTACAFFTLVISQSRGMKEMGIVTGIGLLSILMATLLFLPVMLVFRERYVDKKRNKKMRAIVKRDISFHFLGRIGELLGRRYIFTLLGTFAVSVLFIWSAFRITFDGNFLNMEPKGLTSIALMDTVLEKFDLDMNNAFVLAGSAEQSSEYSQQFRELGSVALTDDISSYLPSREKQQKRIPHIKEVRDMIRSASIRPEVSSAGIPVFRKEIERLEMNIMEFQDMAFLNGQDKVDAKCMELVGDPDDPHSGNIIRELRQSIENVQPALLKGLSDFQKRFGAYFKESVLTMCSTDPVTLADLPESIVSRYCNKTRDLFLVTVYPGISMWKEENIVRFTDDLERISENATGSLSMGLAMIRIFGQDGRNAVLLTLVIVFILLWVDFKSIGHALMAMIPLALGVFWMVGIMNLSGMQLTIMNVIGLPMIVGIGIDDGVHIIHRWKHEGAGKLKTIFSSTGKAIFLTSLTTMFAFGSMVFSVFPAWGQLGGALFVGVGACFLTTVIILSGIIGMIERRKSKEI